MDKRKRKYARHIEMKKKKDVGGKQTKEVMEKTEREKKTHKEERKRRQKRKKKNTLLS